MPFINCEKVKKNFKQNSTSPKFTRVEKPNRQKQPNPSDGGLGL